MPTGRLNMLETFLLEHVVLELGTIRGALADSVKSWPATAAPGNEEVARILARLAALEDEAISLCAPAGSAVDGSPDTDPPDTDPGGRGGPKPAPGRAPDAPAAAGAAAATAPPGAAGSDASAASPAAPGRGRRDPSGARGSARPIAAVVPADAARSPLSLLAELEREIDRLDVQLRGDAGPPSGRLGHPARRDARASPAPAKPAGPTAGLPLLILRNAI
jgi:hypothetical protein